jgi:hypothetical protein
MTNVLENFDIAQDLKVEFFLPDAEGNLFILGISNIGSDDVLAGANQFIVGVSLLGGTDLLSGGDVIAFTWQAFECSVSSLNVEFGGEVIDSLFFQPRPAEADITLQNLIIDPTVNPAMRPGVPVRVRLVRDELDITIYKGYIDTINVAYNQDDKHIMNVRAYDSFKKFVNSRLAILDTADPIEFPEGYASPYEIIEILAEQFGTFLNERSENLEGKIPGTLLENFIPSGTLYDAIQVGLAIFWVDPETEEFVVIPRPIELDGSGKYNIGNQHDTPLHLCMSDIEVLSDIDAVFNSLKVTLLDDLETSVLVKNPDSIQLYGEFAIDQTLNVTDIDELERWAVSVFNQTTTKLVKEVETPAVDRLGALTHAAVINPGETVNINYQTPQLNINEPYTVTKVSHSIDVNNWFTTLELWKEF